MLGNLLDHVPMFLDEPVLQPEEVGYREAAVARPAHDMGVDDDMVAVDEAALDLLAGVRRLDFHMVEPFLEAGNAGLGILGLLLRELQAPL